MDHHNALRQVSLTVGGLTLNGFSISGLATYVQVPELGVCFDLGECPLSALSLDHVFLTHAHGDHARCLPRHWQLRRMLGNAKPAAYFLPASIRAGCEAWVRAEARFEGVPEELIETPAFHGLEGGPELVALPYRKDLRVRAFPVQHSVPSLGYTLFAHKQKLKAEYRALPGAEIARLRKANVAVQEEVDEPLLTFIGDCNGATLLEQAHIWASPVLILEVTFVEPGEEALARKKLHTHLSELSAALEHFGDRVACEHIVLKHFSMKSSPERVFELVRQGLPERFHERVHVFLSPTPEP
jgi:ribonuclease Z